MKVQAPLGDGDAPKMPFVQRCCGITISSWFRPSGSWDGWYHRIGSMKRAPACTTSTHGASVQLCGGHSLQHLPFLAVVHKPAPPFKDHELKQPNVPSSRGLDPSDFQDVFEWTWMRLLKVLALFGQVTLNITFIGYNFYSLPTRDPDEPLNQAKHAVSWVETGWMGYFGIFTLCLFPQLGCFSWFSGCLATPPIFGSTVALFCTEVHFKWQSHESDARTPEELSSQGIRRCLYVCDKDACILPFGCCISNGEARAGGLCHT